ncbi:hypothetical protein LRP67_07575 [Nocardioides sp. cx-169]|uniref:hypothetical protein n=1 Tax=Nocardioides sp. cx-169 TaxID=2899080 RepID=UPI001E40D637|nr:hypothetical protein [Nocardioides sp. cx-169]MCD4533937.1 hypothetical protein [Nocardioides sp. cx-169]
MGLLQWWRRRRGTDTDTLVARELARVRWRIVDEDITLFGEQLAELHVDTMTTELDDDMRADYQKALDRYESATQRFTRESTDDDLIEIGAVLEEGRYHRACVLARRDGTPLPERLPPCFFNPQHGPSVAELAWAPPGGVKRAVPMCREDLNRIEHSQLPVMRVVRVADQYLPWFAAGSAYEALAGTIDVKAVLDGKRAAQGQWALYVGQTQNSGVGIYGSPFP